MKLKLLRLTLKIVTLVTVTLENRSLHKLSSMIKELGMTSDLDPEDCTER